MMCCSSLSLPQSASSSAALHFQIFTKDTFAVIGYGVQGRAQSMNMRDSGLDGKICIGLREVRVLLSHLTFYLSISLS
jgi:ketol-acid reductoisomerase